MDIFYKSIHKVMLKTYTASALIIISDIMLTFLVYFKIKKYLIKMTVPEAAHDTFVSS